MLPVRQLCVGIGTEMVLGTIPEILQDLHNISWDKCFNNFSKYFRATATGLLAHYLLNTPNKCSLSSLFQNKIIINAFYKEIS